MQNSVYRRFVKTRYFLAVIRLIRRVTRAGGDAPNGVVLTNVTLPGMVVALQQEKSRIIASLHVVSVS